MKRIRTLALAAVLAIPFAAHAQTNLAWNDCITQRSAAQNIQYACDGTGHGNPVKLIASFIAPATLTAFVGTQMYIDVTLSSGAGPLPDFWRLGLGGCREQQLTYAGCQFGHIAETGFRASAVAACVEQPTEFDGVGTGTTGACQNPWFVPPHTGGGYKYDMNYQGGGTTRLLTVSANDAPRVLLEGEQFHDRVITLDFNGDVATDQPYCAGCCEPVTITLTRVELYQVARTPPADIYYLTTAATRNFVTWNANGCDGSSNLPVAVQRSSWGAIKSTYR